MKQSLPLDITLLKLIAPDDVDVSSSADVIKIVICDQCTGECIYEVAFKIKDGHAYSEMLFAKFFESLSMSLRYLASNETVGVEKCLPGKALAIGNLVRQLVGEFNIVGPEASFSFVQIDYGAGFTSEDGI